MLVTKDTDFEVTHELGQGPPKPLLITTGNIHNNELLSRFKLTLLNPAAAAGVKTIARTSLACIGSGAEDCIMQRAYHAL